SPWEALRDVQARGRPDMTAGSALPRRSDGGVPLLVTVDVEIAHDRDIAHQRGILERLAIDRAGRPATSFCTATAAEAFSSPLRALARQGHAIGCHGLDHGTWEDYRQLDRQTAGGPLRAATDRNATSLRARASPFPR